MKSIGLNILNPTKYEEITISPRQLGKPNPPLELEYDPMLLYFSTVGKKYKKNLCPAVFNVKVTLNNCNGVI
jgi:hypothetical protein